MTKIKNTTKPNELNITPNDAPKAERPYLTGSIYAGLYERYIQPQTLNLAIHKHNNHHNHFRYLGLLNYPYADMPKSVSANYTIELFFAKSFLHSFRFSFTNPNHTPFQSGLVFTNSRYSGQRETILPDKIFSITDKELHTLLFLLHKYMDSKQSLRCYNIDTYDPYQNKQK